MGIIIIIIISPKAIKETSATICGALRGISGAFMENKSKNLLANIIPEHTRWEINNKLFKKEDIDAYIVIRWAIFIG